MGGTRRLWLRADASRTTGLGHVMRTLAVAERATDRGMDVTYVVGDDATAALVVERGVDARVVERAWVDDVGATDVVVLDGYRFDADLERALRDRGAAVAAIDDRGAGRHDVDVLLDQNLHATQAYDLTTGTVSLMGPSYALIRREFLAHRRRRTTPGDPTLLLTFGGSDPTGLTPWALTALADPEPFARLVAVVGPAADPDDRVLHGDADVVRAPADPAAVFDRADAAISAAGSTSWELLAMGLPTALVAAVDNQVPVRDGLARRGAVLTVDPDAGTEALAVVLRELADPIISRRLSEAGLDLVDGQGADRLLDVLVG